MIEPSRTDSCSSTTVLTHPAHNDSDPMIHDAIARRAYAIYEKGGCQQGHCDENWQKAESEMKESKQLTEAKGRMQDEGGRINVSRSAPAAAAPGADESRITAIAHGHQGSHHTRT
ncbi:DUF2934 domain-containing protein [bacterium]|nr:DUF2934 domain-containing protein [bacterium]